MEKWRLIIDDPAEGSENMAVDEAILSSCEMGDVPSTVRFYEWITPTLSIGYAQRYDTFRNAGVPVIRRMSGGRAVLHDIELTYAVICNRGTSLFSRGIKGSYEVISRAILNALGDLSVNATTVKTEWTAPAGICRESCFSSSSGYEILVRGKKIVGSAQRRFKGAFLQHGSVLFDIKREMVEEIFGCHALDGMAWLGHFGKVNRVDFRNACIKRIEEELGIELYRGRLTGGEESLRDRLIHEKYACDRWNRDGVWGKRAFCS